MDFDVNSRIFLGVFALITASCANNAPTSSAELVEQAREETSWHCEESAGSWSCKRRTIGEIQQRQAASEARKFDWSRSETETLTRVNESSAEPAEIAANEFAEARPTRQMPTEPQTANVVTRPRSDSPAESNSSQGVAAQKSAAYQQLMYRPDAPMSLEDLPSSYWTVQLIALSSARELQGFMSSLQLDGLAGAMIKVNNRTYYVALLGVYETRAAAELAAKKRPESLSRYQPYVRSLGSLQAAMTQASQLPR